MNIGFSGISISSSLGSEFGYGVTDSPYTARTLAFATATGIVDVTILSALSTFDISLITNGIDTKFKALYPFVGGTSTTHKYNFMNAVDSDAAFRLSFNGGWTHSSTGALPNGVNGYADTFLNPSTELTVNSNHIAVYCRTNQASNTVPVGAYDGYNFFQMNIISNSFLYYYSGAISTEIASVLADAKGMFTGTTRASNDRKTFKNATQQGSLTTNLTNDFPNVKLYLGARNEEGSTNNYSSIELAFSSIGDGLTDTDISNFYTAVQTFQTSLSRQV